MADPVLIVTRHFGDETAKQYDVYARRGGYQALRAAIAKDPQEIIA